MLRLPDKQMQVLLLGVVAFNTVPHFIDQPPWLIAAACSALLWSALHIFKGIALPPKWLRYALAFVGAAGVFIEWGTIVGQEPATSLLVFLAGLKMLESTRYRDAMLVIFTSYFLLMAFLLTNQSLPATLFMAADVMLITSLMFQLHKSDRRSSFRSFRPVMRLLGASLPVWILLFVLFPRFSAGFWSFKAKANSEAGFTDNLDPGSVERLLNSDTPAFRVTYTNDLRPRVEDMYWRGAALHKIEGGLRWSRDGYEKLPNITSDAGTGGALVHQEIYLEPDFKKWLFALDVPLMLDFEDRIRNSQTRNRAGFIYETNRDVGSRVAYKAISTGLAPQQKMGEQERKIYLQLPEDLSPEIRALAEKLKAETDGSSSALRERILRYFEDGGFVYTRAPGALQQGTLDEFLFQTKRGFCEHYSAAFSTLMRAAGVPSRVIVGFLGGLANDYGNFVLVRSLDAHAWSEIYNDRTNRWTRVDATAVVAPLRVQLGGEYFEATNENSAYRKSALYRWQQQISLAWDAAAMQWNTFLLRYDFEYQQKLLERMGLYAANRLVFFGWLVVCVAAFLTGMYFVLRRRAAKEEPLLAAYHKFCRRMEAAGLTRYATEGAKTYFARARKLKPEHAGHFDELEKMFNEIRYGQPLTAQEKKKRLKDFKSKAREMNL